MKKPTAVPVVRAALLTALLSVVGGGVHAASDTATATAVVLTPMTITKNTNLVFGNVVQGNGTVTVQTDGTRTLASNTAPAVSGVTATAGKFTVGGTAAQGYAITYTPPATLASGGNTMVFSLLAEAVDAATPTGAAVGTAATFTPAGATSYIFIGGTLTVVATQAAGTYTGNVVVSVDYN